MSENSEEKMQCCKRCSKDITKERVKPEGYCFNCCLKIGDKAEPIFLALIENYPKLVEAFNEYKYDTNLRTSAIILD